MAPTTRALDIGHSVAVAESIALVRRIGMPMGTTTNIRIASTPVKLAQRASHGMARHAMAWHGTCGCRVRGSKSTRVLASYAKPALLCAYARSTYCQRVQRGEGLRDASSVVEEDRRSTHRQPVQEPVKRRCVRNSKRSHAASIGAHNKDTCPVTAAVRFDAMQQRYEMRPHALSDRGVGVSPEVCAVRTIVAVRKDASCTRSRNHAPR